MKQVFLCVLTCLLGLSLGLIINVKVTGETLFPKPSVPDHLRQTALATATGKNAITTPDADGKKEDKPHKNNALSQEALLYRTYQVLDALERKDFPMLSQLVHPQKGVTFTPYSTVDAQRDRKLMPGELSKAADNRNLYIWGLYDDSDTPIQLSIVDYFSKYVYNADYANAPILSVNTVQSAGNSAENVAQAYPDGFFVECYFPELEPKNKGFDWCALKLVFEPVEDIYMLVGAIHSQWTS